MNTVKQSDELKSLGLSFQSYPVSLGAITNYTRKAGETHMNKTVMIIGGVVIVAVIGILLMSNTGGTDNDAALQNDTGAAGTATGDTDTGMESDPMAAGDDAMMGDDSMMDDDSMMEDNAMMDGETGTIVDVAVENGSFETLVAAVQAAGLVETLSSAGPYTVFAPTDEAFAALPAGTVDELLLPENRDQLIAVLTYHVVPGEVPSTEVVNLDSATTVQGADVSIATTADGGVQVNNANVVIPDVEASNGVIHVIDTVLLPPEE